MKNAYEKNRNWVKGDRLEAEHMNHIEDALHQFLWANFDLKDTKYSQNIDEGTSRRNIYGDSSTRTWKNQARINQGNITSSDSSLVVLLDYLPVLPDTEYHVFYNKVPSTIVYTAFYDKNKQYIKAATANTLISVFITPSDAAFVRVTLPMKQYGGAGTQRFNNETEYDAFAEGVLTTPDMSLFEIYNQTESEWLGPLPVTYKEQFGYNTEVKGSSIEANSIDLSQLNFTVHSRPLRPWIPEVGSYSLRAYNGSVSSPPGPSIFGNWTPASPNPDIYWCTAPFMVTPGSTIIFGKVNQQGPNAVFTKTNLRFLTAYDINHNWVEQKDGRNYYVVPDNVRYLMATFYTNASTGVPNPELGYIQEYINDTWQGWAQPGEGIIKIPTSVIEGWEDPTHHTDLHAFLPPEVCVPIGTPIEIYNNLVCIEASKYNLVWTHNFINNSDAAGSLANCVKQSDYKFSINIPAGTSIDLFGPDQAVKRDFSLTLTIRDDTGSIVETLQTQVHIVDPDALDNNLIIPIGDSLTNNKAWASRLYANSNHKITFRGTRGTTDPKATTETLGSHVGPHEGRSGGGVGNYDSKEGYYTFDSNGISTLTSSGSYTDLVAYVQTKHTGETVTALNVNPFWHLDNNAGIDQFDFDWYCKKASEGGAGLFQDSSGNPISLTPDGVIIYLGMNHRGATDQVTIANRIKDLIGYIQSSNKGQNIPIYVPLVQYTGDMYDVSKKIIAMTQAETFYDVLKDVNNIHFIPFISSMDANYAYYTSWDYINPYVSDLDSNDNNLKVPVLGDIVHPQNRGYLQMGDVMFGSIIKYGKQAE